MKNRQRFGIEQAQPSPEEKKAGWARRKVKQKFMDMVLNNQNLTVKDLQERAEKAVQDPDSSSVLEAMAVKYVAKMLTTDKFLIDFLDRHIERAPIEQKVKHKDKKSIVDYLKEMKESGLLNNDGLDTNNPYNDKLPDNSEPVEPVQN